MAPIEISINHFLHQEGDIDLVVDRLLQEYGDTTNPDEVFALAAFLFATHSYQSLLSYALKNLKERRPVPWQYLAELVKKYESYLGTNIQDLLLQGAEEMNELEVLTLSKSLDHKDPRLSAIRAHKHYQALLALEQKKQFILDQIRVFRAQELPEQERLHINRFKNTFPHAPEGAEQEAAYRDKRAQTLLARRKPKTETEKLFDEGENFSVEETQILESILASCKLQSTQDPSLAYNFSILFCMLGSYPHALQLIELTPPSAQKDWLKAECLILSKKYILALEFFLELEQKYSKETETPFAISYLRAQAYWGLKQHSTAIVLLETLISVRPQYRMAQSLYDRWGRDSS